MPAENFPGNYPFLSADRLLTFPQILTFIEAARDLGLKKVKLTGGEPLLRSLLPELVLSIKTRWPELEVGLITNGLHLGPLIPRLKSGGLDQITVSLDSLDPDGFGTMTGSGHRVETVLSAIEQVRQVWGQVKINTVLIRGQNEGQTEPLVRHFRRPGFLLRFIEFMDVGTLNRWDRRHVVTGAEVLAQVQEWPDLPDLVPQTRLHPGQTSQMWAWADGKGQIGFINSVTQPFCGDCSRLRLGPDGQVYTCLFSSRGRDFGAALRSEVPVSELRDQLAQVWLGRKDRYSELRTDGSGERVEMFAVGG